MEIFHFENKKYIAVCPECNEILKFEINTNNMGISGKCKNGHTFHDKSVEYFTKYCIRSSNDYNIKCHNCYEIIKDDCYNFICLRCQHLFCQKCISLHNRKEKHNLRKNYINTKYLCPQHNKKYKWYCETCKINICSECNTFNTSHNIKPFIDIIPSQKEKDLINKNASKFEEFIAEIKSKSKSIVDEVIKRSKKLNQYLEFLNEINNKLFQNYNGTFFDYYNFENIKYISNLLNKEELYNTDKYIDYILGKHNLNIEEISIIKRKEKNQNKLILDNLEYYKDNLFISYKDKNKFIYLYEYSNFDLIEKSKYNVGNCGQIHSIKSAKYSNNIIINFKNKKNIKFLEYNELNNKLKIAKEEIKAIRIYPCKNFTNFIDNKNQNIVTIDNLGELVVWKKKNDKLTYIKCLSFKENFNQIFNINDSLFCINNNNNTIKIYQSTNYQCIKTINFNCNPVFIGIINNQLLVFYCNFKNSIFIVDEKYFEIIKILKLKDFDYKVKIKNDNLFLFYFNSKDVFKYQKKSYDIKEGVFKCKIKKKCEGDFFDLPEIIITDNYYTVLFDKHKFILIKT